MNQQNNPLRAMIPAQQSGATTERREFGAMQTTTGRVENAAALVAAEAKAATEARYIVAWQRPRDMDQVRQDVLRECRRPSFAENKSVLYHKPIGDGVEGLGIRFVEMALRSMRNIMVETRLVEDSIDFEVHRVIVTDLESNLTYPQDVRVSKTVERGKPEDDGSYIAVRMNSRGRPVYTVRATDEDLLNKRGALVSKAIRTLGLRIIPGDLCDEAEAMIRRTREDSAAADPDAERKRIADAFADIGVRASDLADYLGHDLATCSPSELAKLRGVYGAIRDGQATWKQFVEGKREGAQEPATAPQAPATKAEPVSAHAAPTSAPAVAQATFVEPAPPPSPFTFQSVAAMLDKAKTVDDLDLAVDAIRAIVDGAQREILERRSADIRSKLAKGKK